MAGLFVTGTDTGVGKTVVSALLTLGLDADYWKPVQSGIEPSTDTADVRAWTGLPEERFLPERWRLQLPASPHLAASVEGVRIDLEDFALPRSYTSGQPWQRPLIVEGAGGLLVPLNEQALMIDLIARLRLPVVLVARTSLGTINHTLLSLEALRARGLPVVGVVLNGAEHVSNEQAIRQYGRVAVLGRIPPLPALTAPQLREAFRSCFNEEALMLLAASLTEDTVF